MFWFLAHAPIILHTLGPQFQDCSTQGIKKLISHVGNFHGSPTGSKAEAWYMGYNKHVISISRRLYWQFMFQPSGVVVFNVIWSSFFPLGFYSLLLEYLVSIYRMRNQTLVMFGRNTKLWFSSGRWICGPPAIGLQLESSLIICHAGWGVQKCLEDHTFSIPGLVLWKWA